MLFRPTLDVSGSRVCLALLFGIPNVYLEVWLQSPGYKAFMLLQQSRPKQTQHKLSDKVIDCLAV